ncbi:hypothetical protein BJX63DRAFT_437269 [Aspergillus granulosus]|uniref:Myb-like domain-containing protein n=1 Tax=Aspergillus granulosus TaxID=176169 RepID=A0ABR4GVL1_9EURO
MSTFLFYNPNSNPSRYSKKARFSKRESVLLGTKQSALNLDHDGKVNRGSTSSVCPAQSSIRNIYDLQPVGLAPSTATLRSTEPPNQDNETFSEHNISDVESLRSLFLGSDLGAGARFLEDTCITQPDPRFDGQQSIRDSRQPLEGVASEPDLATYYLNLSPSPKLRAHDFVIADDHATGHQSEVILPLRADDPTNFGESAAVWESDERYTSLNDDETRMDADEGTSIDQSVNKPASDSGPCPGTSSPALTESSDFGSPHYANEYDSLVENAHGSIRDPETCHIAPTEETCLWDLDNTFTTSQQPLVGKEREGSVPNITGVVPESNRVSPISLTGACSETGAQGHASSEPTSPQKLPVNYPIVLGKAPFASEKPTHARSSSRTSSYLSCRKTVAEFSHVEIPSRPIAEVSRPSVAITSPDRRDWSYHPSLINGPWRLDGTTLSIDLRDAEQVPIFVGYSSFRVYEGKLTQSLTFFQGPTNGPLVNKPARTPSPPVPARGPLSLEQKQRLVKLKQEGYTWDEIVPKFPGRKRSNLQAIYSRSLKDFRRPGSLQNYPSRRPSSVPRSSSNSRILAEMAGNGRIKAQRTNQGKGKKSRYNLRARGNR